MAWPNARRKAKRDLKGVTAKAEEIGEKFKQEPGTAGARKAKARASLKHSATEAQLECHESLHKVMRGYGYRAKDNAVDWLKGALERAQCWASDILQLTSNYGFQSMNYSECLKWLQTQLEGDRRQKVIFRTFETLAAKYGWTDKDRANWPLYNWLAGRLEKFQRLELLAASAGWDSNGTQPINRWLEEYQRDLGKIIQVAQKHGWNGVSNPKAIWDFFDDALQSKPPKYGRKSVSIVDPVIVPGGDPFLAQFRTVCICYVPYREIERLEDIGKARMEVAEFYLKALTVDIEWAKKGSVISGKSWVLSFLGKAVGNGESWVALDLLNILRERWTMAEKELPLLELGRTGEGNVIYVDMGVKDGKPNS